MGEKRVFMALALATMLLCTVGVFIDVAVITVAPVALSIGKRLNLSPSVLLIAMIGGGKCGNIISPNPNTIIAAGNFNADLSAVMFANILPAVIGLFFTVFVIVRLMPQSVKNKKTMMQTEDKEEERNLPGTDCQGQGFKPRAGPDSGHPDADPVGDADRHEAAGKGQSERGRDGGSGRRGPGRSDHRRLLDVLRPAHHGNDRAQGPA